MKQSLLRKPGHLVAAIVVDSEWCIRSRKTDRHIVLDQEIRSTDPRPGIARPFEGIQPAPPRGHGMIALVQPVP